MKEILVINPVESMRVHRELVKINIGRIIDHFGSHVTYINKFNHTISTPNCRIRFTYITEFEHMPERFKGIHYDGIFGKYILAQDKGMIYEKTRVGKDWFEYVKEVEEMR